MGAMYSVLESCGLAFRKTSLKKKFIFYLTRERSNQIFNYDVVIIDLMLR